jgi:hypothetical protein|tara:strand:+ start:1228 stop:1341 length:114 start_codon:yes stop_codon:yes gene_type:complete
MRIVKYAVFKIDAYHYTILNLGKTGRIDIYRLIITGA